MFFLPGKLIHFHYSNRISHLFYIHISRFNYLIRRQQILWMGCLGARFFSKNDRSHIKERYRQTEVDNAYIEMIIITLSSLMSYM